MTGWHWLILAAVTVAAVLWLWLTRRRPRIRPADAEDLGAAFEVTHEPERERRTVPLHEADTGWLLARRTMLDQTVRRDASRIGAMCAEHDAISRELCERAQGEAFARAVETNLKEHR